MQADITRIYQAGGSDDFSLLAYLRLRLCQPSFGSTR
jgi:hypothetical protein